MRFPVAENHHRDATASPHALFARRADNAEQRGPAYLTVELPDDEDDEGGEDDGETASDADAAELIDGERLNGGAYHYFPSPERVAGWLDDGGLTIHRQEVGDGYLHLLCRRRAP